MDLFTWHATEQGCEAESRRSLRTFDVKDAKKKNGKRILSGLISSTIYAEDNDRAVGRVCDLHSGMKMLHPAPPLTWVLWRIWMRLSGESPAALCMRGRTPEGKVRTLFSWRPPEDMLLYKYLSVRPIPRYSGVQWRSQTSHVIGHKIESGREMGRTWKRNKSTARGGGVRWCYGRWMSSEHRSQLSDQTGSPAVMNIKVYICRIWYHLFRSRCK